MKRTNGKLLERIEDGQTFSLLVMNFLPFWISRSRICQRYCENLVCLIKTELGT